MTDSIRDHAERLAAERYKHSAADRDAFVSGYLDGRIVSAEQIEAAAEAAHESNRRSNGTRWNKQLHYIKDRYRLQAREAFRAAGMTVEGEE